MTKTFVLLLIMMAGLFLLLWAAVGFIQDKRFFGSAPKEVQEVVQPKEERFKGQHILGWMMGILALCMLLGSVLYGARDGIQKGFTFGQFLTRFLILMWGVQIYDVCIFDYYLLCRSSFFTHYYPETEPVLGPHLFGYNMKSHLTEALFLLLVSLVLSWICTVL